jgi:hypothetical protein
MIIRRASDWWDDFQRRKNRRLPCRAALTLPLRDWTARDRITVFHHIPKCSGTSVVNVLGQWFLLKEDYRAYVEGDWRASRRVALDTLRNRHCLTGHFDYQGVFLRDRYPAILADRRFFLFTFVREPLATKLSLYRYEKQSGLIPDMTLEEHLLTRENYIAGRLPCRDDDVDAVLARYDFMGVTEHIGQSLNELARLVNRKPVGTPRLNVTGTSARDTMPGTALIREFERRNRLDYYIYQLALRRLVG